MRTLDQLPEHESKDGYLHRVCIPCAYNSGRRATVRATVGHPEIIHISIDTEEGRPYQIVQDGYLHLDMEFIRRGLDTDPEAPITGYRHKEALEMVEMIKGINIHYFAGTLTVLSDSKALIRRTIPRFRTPSQIALEVKEAYVNYPKTIDFGWLFEEAPRKPLGPWSRCRRVVDRISYAAHRLSRMREEIEVAAPLAEAHLGGTWQSFYDDKSWLDQAEALRGGRVYLA